MSLASELTPGTSIRVRLDRAPRVAYDLPAGGRRLIQRARGYTATVVAGEITYRNGEAMAPCPAGCCEARAELGGHAPTSRTLLTNLSPTASTMLDPVRQIALALETCTSRRAPSQARALLRGPSGRCGRVRVRPGHGRPLSTAGEHVDPQSLRSGRGDDAEAGAAGSAPRRFGVQSHTAAKAPEARTEASLTLKRPMP